MSQIPGSHYLIAIAVGVITSPYTLGPAQALVAPALVISGVAAAIFALKSVVHGKCVKNLQKKVDKTNSSSESDPDVDYDKKIAKHTRKQKEAKDLAMVAVAGAAFFACSVIPVVGTTIGAVVALHIHAAGKKPPYETM